MAWLKIEQQGGGSCARFSGFFSASASIEPRFGVTRWGFALPDQMRSASMNYVYLSFAIIAEVIGTTFIKQSEGFTKLVPGLITAAAYVVAF